MFDPKKISVKVYNTSVKKIKTLKVINLPGAFSEAEWDGTNEKGIIVASGMYFVHVRAKDANNKLQKKTVKVIFLK